LERLKLKETVFDWTPECQQALDTLKRKLASPPILAYPDFDLPFSIYVDACPIAMDAVLMQTQNGYKRVIAYASQALDASQQKWIAKKDGTSEIECFGLVWATTKFRHYVDRRHFTIYTDHAALVWLYKTGSKSGNGKLARWIAHLQSMEFTVIHRPGVLMGCADGLSRLPIDGEETEPTPTHAFRWNLETAEFDEQPLPEDFARVCHLTKGLFNPPRRVMAVTRSQTQDDRTNRRNTPAVSGAQTAEETTENEPEEMVPNADEPAQENEALDHGVQLPAYREEPYELPGVVLVRMQGTDPFVTAMKGHLMEGAYPMDAWLMKLIARTRDHYTVRDQILYRRVTLKSPLRNPQLQLVPVIPLAMTTKVLELCHDSPLAG
jgi:hypothetical protein